VGEDGADSEESDWTGMIFFLLLPDTVSEAMAWLYEGRLLTEPVSVSCRACGVQEFCAVSWEDLDTRLPRDTASSSFSSPPSTSVTLSSGALRLSERMSRLSMLSTLPCRGVCTTLTVPIPSWELP